MPFQPTIQFACPVEFSRKCFACAGSSALRACNADITRTNSTLANMKKYIKVAVVRFASATQYDRRTLLGTVPVQSNLALQFPAKLRRESRAFDYTPFRVRSCLPYGRE